MAPATAVSCQARHSHELPHVAIFPLMAKGHTIPLLDLTCLLLRRRLTSVTLFTTPGNAALVRAALAAGGAEGAAVVELPSPSGHATGEEGIESVASASSPFAAFVESTKMLQPRFEEALAAMRPPASLLVADGFLYWAHASAAALGVPRLSFLGTSAFAHVIREVCVRDKPGANCGGAGYDASTGTYTVPEFPHLRFSLAEFSPLPAPAIELDAKMAVAVAASHGMIMNTIHGLESRYIEHWNQHIGPKAWPLGPLCLARQSPTVDDPAHAKPSWMRWLDEKASAGRPVLYIAFGTLAAIPEVQLKEVADGLDRAEVDFLWAVRPANVDLGTGYEDRVEGKGKVVREWVDQWEILQHASVRGFFSHCGWNSVLESVTAGVPLAVWPLEFEQPINARLVVDELRVGIRVHSSDGKAGGLVKSEEVTRVVRELISGEAGVAMSASVAAIAAQARLAGFQGGSSWNAVEEAISELCITNTAEKATEVKHLSSV
ncbi:UDP-glycosyltransferase 90A1-like [Phragmites australis]|uniref:UDP-glycosyltransferase 90A1-like n=1 Tax=Phragmites australis TaxID=29695 RepID=UPI002D77081D|nr:UDP-glycosyltransferase 90A1-like [Phragmites australis]